MKNTENKRKKSNGKENLSRGNEKEIKVKVNYRKKPRKSRILQEKGED